MTRNCQQTNSTEGKEGCRRSLLGEDRERDTDYDGQQLFNRGPQSEMKLELIIYEKLMVDTLGGWITV